MTLIARRSALLLIAGAAATPAFAQSSRRAAGPVLSPADRATVAAASAALAAVRLSQGAFTQINPDRRQVTGRFWLSRPGRVRFEYDNPSPLLIVADGATVAIEDRALKTVDRAPLRATPLHFVLRNGLDIARDAAVQRVERNAEQALVSVRDRTGEADGLLTLVFTGDVRTLSGWRVEPGAGGATQVFLRDVTTPATIDPKLFIMRDPPRRPRPR
jgi:outer membrane lipoprotein-sorting protein